jgi:hypothetical protein
MIPKEFYCYGPPVLHQHRREILNGRFWTVVPENDEPVWIQRMLRNLSGVVIVESIVNAEGFECVQEHEQQGQEQQRFQRSMV